MLFYKGGLCFTYVDVVINLLLVPNLGMQLSNIAFVCSQGKSINYLLSQ